MLKTKTEAFHEANGVENQTGNFQKHIVRNIKLLQVVRQKETVEDARGLTKKIKMLKLLLH